MTASRLPASWMNALDPAAGARRSRWTAAPAGAPRCPYISRRSRPTSGQTVTVPSSFRRGELPRRLRVPFARNVIPGAHATVRARGLLLAANLLAPVAAGAQPTGKVYRLGIAWVGTPAATEPLAALFRRALAAIRYLER